MEIKLNKIILKAWHYLMKVKPKKYRVCYNDGILITELYMWHYDSGGGFSYWTEVNAITMECGSNV